MHLQSVSTQQLFSVVANSAWPRGITHQEFTCWTGSGGDASWVSVIRLTAIVLVAGSAQINPRCSWRLCSNACKPFLEYIDESVLSVIFVLSSEAYFVLSVKKNPRLCWRGFVLHYVFLLLSHTTPLPYWIWLTALGRQQIVVRVRFMISNKIQ